MGQADFIFISLLFRLEKVSKREGKKKQDTDKYGSSHPTLEHQCLSFATDGVTSSAAILFTTSCGYTLYYRTIGSLRVAVLPPPPPR